MDIILSATARTRALYLWEDQDLDIRPGVYPYRSLVGMREDLSRMWRLLHITRGKRRIPLIEFIRRQDAAYCDGLTRIVLTSKYCTNMVLLHEVVHALGYGSVVQPHSRSFVTRYIECLSQWFTWEYGELLMQAKFRKLL